MATTAHAKSSHLVDGTVAYADLYWLSETNTTQPDPIKQE